MSLLDHVELSIVKGVGPTPSDTVSAEQPLVIVDLLTTGSAFALVEWTPNIPSLKSGGVWADSSISDGRTLIAGVNTNVTETMTVQLTGSTIADFASQFAKFQRMIQDARDFWDTFNQIEPVYIRWWANNAPGPQFALIYNIDMDVEWGDSNLAQATLTLTIEREFGWRGVHPGGNPKIWTYYKRNQIYNASVAALTSGTDHLLNAVSQNRREWNSAQSALISQNYFDIPATSIPGDLPALVCLSSTITGTSGIGAQMVYFARESKPDLLPSGVIRRPAYILNAGEATLGTDTSTAADTGAPIVGVAQTALRSVTTFATATVTQRLSWTGAARMLFDMSSLRGRFAAFARARVSAAATVSMNLRAVAGSNITQVYPSVTLTDLGGGGVGNTTSWSFVYLGLLTFPFSNERILTDDNGLGVNVSTGGNYALALDAGRTAGAGSLYVSDILLLPIDETAGLIDMGTTAGSFVIDNTGYFLHGRTGDESHAGGIVMAVEQSGASLTLQPGVQNRIILFETNAASPPQAEIAPVFTSRLNIVPRWSGVRDV